MSTNTHTPTSEVLHEGEEAPPRGVRAMAVTRWLLIFGLLGAAIYTAGRAWHWWDASVATQAKYRCPMHPSVVADRPGTCPICGMDLVAIADGAATASGEKAPAWVCPIHPEHGGEGPGACRVCGEALVVNPRAAPKSLSAVTLDSVRAQQIGVRTARVRKSSLVHEAGFAGVVTLDERGLSRVQTRFSGWLESVAVTETGAAVRKGQVLATLFSNDVHLAQMELVHALDSASRAPSKEMAEVHRSLVNAARKRLSVLGVSAADIDALARTRKVERVVAVRAPASGRILSRSAFPSAYVQPGTELFALADLSRVWFVADVPETDAVQVRRGQRAQLRFHAYPTRVFSARATFVYPLADAAARTIKVRFELRNPKGLLRPGMFGRVSISTRARQALVAPAESIIDTGELRYAFVAKAGGRFEPRRVATGERHGEDVVILAGLDEGEEVVTSASFLIDSESRLRAAAAGMTADAPTIDGGPPGAETPAKDGKSEHGGGHRHHGGAR